jgi:hypothetical protein
LPGVEAGNWVGVKADEVGEENAGEEGIHAKVRGEDVDIEVERVDEAGVDDADDQAEDRNAGEDNGEMAERVLRVGSARAFHHED